MPDDQGNFKPGGFTINGVGGELRHGWRVATDLTRWSAEVKEVSEDERTFRMQMVVRSHEPEDRHWFDNVCPDSGLKLVVDFGSKQMAGPARIVTRVPALVVEATVTVE